MFDLVGKLMSVISWEKTVNGVYKSQQTPSLSVSLERSNECLCFRIEIVTKEGKYWRLNFWLGVAWLGQALQNLARLAMFAFGLSGGYGRIKNSSEWQINWFWLKRKCFSSVHIISSYRLMLYGWHYSLIINIAVELEPQMHRSGRAWLFGKNSNFGKLIPKRLRKGVFDWAFELLKKIMV